MIQLSKKIPRIDSKKSMMSPTTHVTRELTTTFVYAMLIHYPVKSSFSLPEMPYIQHE